MTEKAAQFKGFFNRRKGDKGSREYSSEEKKVVPNSFSSKKEASTLSGETIKSPQY